MTERHEDLLPGRDDVDGWAILSCDECPARIVAHKASHVLHHGDHGHTVVPQGMHANSVRPPRLT